MPDWEALETHIKKRLPKTEKGVQPSQQALSLEEQIAECQARLGEAAPGSDEWAEAYDTLRQLRQEERVVNP